MPTFRIRMINAEFESCDESDFATLEAASKNAIASGARVVAESIVDGNVVSAVELQIHADDRLVAHHIVNMSVSDLLLRD